MQQNMQQRPQNMMSMQQMPMQMQQQYMQGPVPDVQQQYQVQQIINSNYQQQQKNPGPPDYYSQLPSLHVGNLPKESFYDLDLYKFFKRKGCKVIKARVVLDKKTCKSYGYGYLAFSNDEDAEKCLKDMNNAEIYGHQIVLSNTKNKNFNEKANILVKNIEKDITQADLFEEFKNFGPIVSCKLEHYPDGSSRGFAYIQFQNEQDADKAREEMDKKEFKGKSLEISQHQKKEKRENQQQKFNNLYVKNLPEKTDQDTLKQMFEEFGEIESVFMPQNEDKTYKDFGYVCFKNNEDAEKALEQMNKKTLENGQFLIVNRHISKRENELVAGGDSSKIGPISQNLTKTFNSNVYVKFIPKEVTDEQIQQTFSEAGKIISIKINKSSKMVENEEVVNYQFGYILYEKVEEAQLAIKKFDNSNVFGQRPIKVELWMSRDEIEQDKKQKEQRDLNQMLNVLISDNKTSGMQQQQQQQQQYPQQQMPMMQQQQQQQYPMNQQRGQMNNPRSRGNKPKPYQNQNRMQYQQQMNMYPSQQFQQQQQNMYPPPMGMNAQMRPPPVAMQNQVQLPPNIDYNSMLQIQDPNERRQNIGNLLYNAIIGAVGEQNAGKITGMLLDENVVNLEQLLQDPAYLNSKITEGLHLIMSQSQQPNIMSQ